MRMKGVNNMFEPNVAAWMIAGGPRDASPADDRARTHRMAIEAARPVRTGVVARIVAAIRPLQAEPASCPA